MEFTIDIDNVRLLKESQVESGEYNVTECNFTFSVEYEELTKKAVFTSEDGTAYLQTIVDGKCSIPSEILSTSQVVQIGVYAYAVDNEELVLRYSPKPTQFCIDQGSYKEAQNSTPPTPSEIEQLQSQITANSNDIDTLQENYGTYDTAIANLQSDVTDIKTEQTTQNENIQTNTSDIATIKAEQQIQNSNISSLQEDVNGLKTNVATNTNDITNIKEEQTTQNTNISNLQENKANKNEIPTSTSDLTNDSGFITKNVDDLTNYYKKNETYNQQEIDTKISSVYRYKGTVSTYQDLPSTDLTIGDVYNVESDGSNYAWTGITWDKLGGDIDLSDYYTKTQTDSLLSSKQNSITSSNKLASDLIDDTNQTNKFVTSAEKTQIATNTSNIALKENLSNKVTSLSSSSTDTQYPSAKCVYDLVGDIESILETLDVRKRGVVYEYKFKNNRNGTTHWQRIRQNRRFRH